MKIARVLAPVLAVLILLAMTGAPALIGIAQVGSIVNAPVQDGVAASVAVGMPEMDGSDAPGEGYPGSDTAPALTAAYTADGTRETSFGQSVASASADQNAVLVENGGNLTMTNATIQKSGDTTSADQSNFYSLNACVAATSESTIAISDSAITSDSEGSSAIFATGEGSTADVSNVTISTTGNSSCGLYAARGGTVTAKDVTITTTGAHSATLTSGEGSITVDKATLSSSGDGSPIIHSTGNITGTNLTGAATGGPMMVIEGKNSITVTDSDLTGAGENGIMLYQSTSSGATEGTASLETTNCKLNSTSTGPFFYVTNTQAEATLSGNTLTYSSGILAQISGNNLSNWGAPGENGGNFTLNGVGQVLSGDVTVDAISAFTLSLNDGSIYTGAVDTQNAGQLVTAALDNNSSWTLTADSHVDALTDGKSDLSNIQSNGFTLYYDASNAANVWLNGQTVALSGGGSLTPEAT